MRKRSYRKYRFKIRALKRFTKGVALFALTTLLLLTSFTVGASANENETYWNDDKTVSVLVTRSLTDEKDDSETNQLNLSFEITSQDSIEIDGVSLFNNQLSQTGDRYDYVVGVNGEYKFSVRTTRYETIIKENGESVQCVRQETFNFTVNVFEIESQKSDDLIDNNQLPGIESDTEIFEIESHNTASDNTPQEQDIVKSIEIDRTQITSIPNGTIVRTLDRIPDKDEILDLLAEDEYVYYKQETNTVCVVKDNIVAQQRSAAYASASVTTGEVLSSGVSFYWKENASYYWEDIAFTEIFVNGIRSYCIEPTILNVSSGNANSTALSEIGLIRVMDGVLYTSLTHADEKEIELVSNYGDKYPGHQTLAYSWATQIGVYDRVGWGFNSYGTLNPQAEINEINRLIGLHTDKPTWSGTTQNVFPNEIVTLTDPTIQYFDIHSTSTGIEVVSKTGNTVKIKVIAENAKVVFSKKRGNEIGTSYVYTDGTSQRVSTFGLSDPVRASKNFKLLKSTITFNKTDDTGRPVEGLGIEASYTQDFSVLIGRYTTDSNGLFKVPNLEINRTLYYREYSAPEGIVIDPTIKAFTPTGTAHTINIVNDVRQLLIGKASPESEPLQATFELYRNYYSENPELVTTVTTSEIDGLVLIDYLDKGLYTIKEVWVQEPYYVDVNNNTQDIIVDDIRGISKYEVEFVNEKVTGEFVITKLDAKNKAPIEGVKYGIYDITDLQVDDDTALTYADVKALEPSETRLTDELGKATFDTLDISRKWVVIELSAPYGYVVDESLNYVEFEYVDCDTPVITHVAELLNERLQVTIKGIKIDSITKSNIISKHFVLQLKDSDGNIIPVDHKDEDGTHYWKVDALEYYYFSELTPPIGYIKSDEVVKISTFVEEADHLYTIEFPNDAEPAPLPQTGVSDNNNLMMLATFIIILGTLFLFIIRRSKLNYNKSLGNYQSHVSNSIVQGTTKTHEHIEVNKVSATSTNVNDEAHQNLSDEDRTEKQERPSHEKTRRME